MTIKNWMARGAIVLGGLTAAGCAENEAPRVAIENVDGAAAEKSVEKLSVTDSGFHEMQSQMQQMNKWVDAIQDIDVSTIKTEDERDSIIARLDAYSASFQDVKNDLNLKGIALTGRTAVQMKLKEISSLSL